MRARDSKVAVAALQLAPAASLTPFHAYMIDLHCSVLFEFVASKAACHLRVISNFTGAWHKDLP
jgi:hypothetical protein